MTRLRSCRSRILAGCAALTMLAAASTPQVESRLVMPSASFLDTFWHHRDEERNHKAAEARVTSYFGGSGFPRAGRSLQQKINEADRFLREEIPKSGIVGVGAAIVYKDSVVLSKGYGLRMANDSSSEVTETSLFQIGSVTKTMITVAIGLLVEEGKLQWRDPVKKRLPWLTLVDKYQEEHVNIGDLLSMNSGFGAIADLGDFTGHYPTERGLVEALEFFEPQHSLREQPEYANINFSILGQLIESVSGLPWHEFLRGRVWEPLGMNHTFASPNLVPTDTEQMNAGHFACGGETLGPYDLVESEIAVLSPGRDRGLDAAGSVLSSAADMATFMRLILNKGSVNGVTLLKDPATIAEMITGKVKATMEPTEANEKMGLHYSPDGGMLSAGYGLDIIGHVIWGHAYFDKSGDVNTHQTRTGFAPSEQLGVTFMGNTQTPSGHATYFMDHYRSYVMGIFLDVPKDVLDFQFKKWRAADILEPPTAGAPRCGLSFWKNPPELSWDKSEIDAIVGEYVSSVSPKFFPSIVISRGDSDDRLTFTMAQRSGSALYIGDVGDNKLLFVNASLQILAVASPQPEGIFGIDIGIAYYKK